jgi:hypothetical protein
MTAPEDRIYCSDPWCDGDHVFSGQTCEQVERERDERAAYFLEGDNER